MYHSAMMANRSTTAAPIDSPLITPGATFIVCASRESDVACICWTVTKADVIVGEPLFDDVCSVMKDVIEVSELERELEEWVPKDEMDIEVCRVKGRILGETVVTVVTTDMLFSTVVIVNGGRTDVGMTGEIDDEDDKVLVTGPGGEVVVRRQLSSVPGCTTRSSVLCIVVPVSSVTLNKSMYPAGNGSAQTRSRPSVLMPTVREIDGLVVTWNLNGGTPPVHDDTYCAHCTGCTLLDTNWKLKLSCTGGT